jgi:hypothetical protein
MSHWQGIAYQALQRLGTMEGQQGITNMLGVTNNLIWAARKLSDTPTAPLIMSDAQRLYVGGPGWYQDSIDAATKLTNQWLQAIVAAG